MIFTLNLLPFIILIAFVIALSYVLVIKSDLVQHTKLAIPLIGIFLILSHLFWIIDSIGRPIHGIPKNQFEYLAHRTIFIDEKGYTELWVKEKGIRTSRLHIFLRDENINEKLDKIRNDKKKNKKGKTHKFGTPNSNRKELNEIIEPILTKPNKSTEATDDELRYNAPF